MPAASSRGISHFLEDGLADVRLQPPRSDNIHCAAKALFQDALDGDQIEQIALVGEVDEKVDIGVGARIAARHGTEHSDPPDMMGRQRVAAAVDRSQSLRESRHVSKDICAAPAGCSVTQSPPHPNL